MARLLFLCLLLAFIGQSMALNLLGLLSALFEPKCPQMHLLEGKCSCELVDYKLHYTCDLANSTGFWTNMVVISDNGGAIAKVEMRNCKKPLGDLYRNLPFIKTRLLRIQNCGITSVPHKAFYDSRSFTDELDLSQNELKSVDFLSHQLPFLKKLNLSYNLIQSVEPNAFKYLEKLHNVDLSHNQIREFSPEAFDKSNSKLHTLDLSYNQLEGLLPHMFSLRESTTVDSSKTADDLDFQGFPHLRWLFLHHNSIRSIQAFAFGSLPVLLLLDLRSNEIEYIHRQAFGRLPTLKTLHLGANQLKQIDQIAYEKMPTVRQLLFNDNHIEAIPSGLFNNNLWLWKLDLSNNNITHIPSNAFEGLYLFKLNVTGNPMSPLEAVLWNLKGTEARAQLIDQRSRCEMMKSKKKKECKNNRIFMIAQEVGY